MVQGARSYRRLRIGLILASIHTGSSPILWRAIHEEAERKDVDLFIFPGGPLETGGSYDRQRNQIYDLVGEMSLDGIISWASSLGGRVATSEIGAFHERFRQIPCVTLSYEIEGFPCVTIDAYKGMQELLYHFLTIHRVQSIAFIRGPTTHVSAEERYRAYVDTMQAWGIGINPLWITDPMPWDGGEEAAHLLIDTRKQVPGKDFQALVGASDLQMFGAVRLLQQRGYRIPEDLLVGGFNNIMESQILSPQLSTVAMPFQEQGKEALQLLLKKIQKKPCPASVSLPTHLVIRESCGCPSNRTLEADPYSFRNSVPETLDALLHELSNVLEMDSVSRESWLVPLLQGLERDLFGNGEGQFLKMLHSILERSIHSDRPIPPWQDGVSVLRKSLPMIWHRIDLKKLEAFCAQARVMISDAIERFHTMNEWRRAQQDSLMREVERRLLMATDLEELKQILRTDLLNLGIHSGYLFLNKGNLGSLVHAECVFGFPPEKTDLISTHRNKRTTFFVLPLFHQHDSLGYVVLEMNNPNPSLYEEIRTYLSSALKGIFLYREVVKAKEAAESAERFKSRMLANISEQFRKPVAEMLMKASEGIDQFRTEKLPVGIRDVLAQIRQSAEHQLYITNEIIDLAKAEVQDLPLNKSLQSPVPILRHVFDQHKRRRRIRTIEWVFEIPDVLPWVFLDEERFTQILFALLEAIDSLVKEGTVQVKAAIVLPYLRIGIHHSGVELEDDQMRRMFEPFDDVKSGGVRLSLARHLTILHGGQLEVERAQNGGTAFFLSLPLPTPSGIIPHVEEHQTSSLLCLGKNRALPPCVEALCKDSAIEPVWMSWEPDWQRKIKDTPPLGISVDLPNCSARDCMILRILLHHPFTNDVPFLIFGDTEVRGMHKTDSLLTFFRELFPAKQMGPIICVSKNPEVREKALETIETGEEAVWILLFSTFEEAVESFQRVSPCSILLDLPEEETSSIADNAFPPGTRVIVLCSEVSKSRRKAHVTEGSCLFYIHRGILSIPQCIEIGLRLAYAREGTQRSIQIVQGVIEYIELNYGKNISRWQLADTLNVSEDYLTRVFRKQMGITPWEYVLRYRVLKAQQFLLTQNRTIRDIAEACGFHDQAYFCRVFRSLTGTSPREYQRHKSI